VKKGAVRREQLLNVEFLTDYVDGIKPVKPLFSSGRTGTIFLLSSKKNVCYGYTDDCTVADCCLCALCIRLLPFDTPAFSED